MSDEKHTEQRVIHLQVVAGPDTGRMFFLKAGKEALIGRAATADLRLTDPGVSQKHCLVRSAGDIVFVEDLKSRNGIKVNGEPAEARVLDEEGKIELGETTVQLKFVKTEAEVPLSSVASPAAPTLLEGHQPRQTERRQGTSISRAPHPGSTLDAAQLQDFQAAKSMLGLSVAGYMLLEPLGLGASGPVFRAKHMKTRVEAALKLILKSDARAPEMLSEFLKNTRTGLAIPGAVNLIETGEDGKFAFIAMAMYRGRDLQWAVADGKRFKGAEALALAQSLCQTLAAAHARHVIHRDIRPTNVLLTADGSPLLLDLGFPKKTDTEGKFILPLKDDPVSRVRYLSPELTRSAACDARADIFSLAATLHFAVSGVHPFDAKTPLETIRKIRWEDPAPLGDAVPEAFNKAIVHAMNKEAEQRYATAQDFAAALAG